jgi:hypothetical protein
VVAVPRIVDEEVDVAQALARRFRRRKDVIAIGNIAGQDVRFAAALSDLASDRLELGLASSDERYARTFVSQPQGEQTAYAAGRSRDDRREAVVRLELHIENGTSVP